MVMHVAMNKHVGGISETPSGRSKTSTYAAATAESPQRQAAPDQASDLPPLEPHVLAQAVSDLTQNMQNLHRALEFSIDENSGRTVVTVIDKETRKVIRQIPQKDILALASRIEKAAGLLVHEEA